MSCSSPAIPPPASSPPVAQLVPGRVVRVPRLGVALRVHERTVIVYALLALAALVMTVLSIGTGEYHLSPSQVVRALVGEGNWTSTFLVQTLRLPRALTALIVGGALGASGAIFQSITRNPLGSPDVIGFTQGAATAAVLDIAVFGGGTFAVAAGSLVGGLLTAIVVYVLAYQGGVHGYRLVLVGIGLSTMLQAARSYLLTRANLDVAQTAQVWLLGSLDGRGWDYVRPLAAVLVVLVPLTAIVAPRLSILELGDEAAGGLGLRVERSRLALLSCAVALAAIATAAAGPVAFVALAAPQIARRLTRAPGIGLTAAALTGALIMIGADYAAQRILPATPLPAGVLTGAIGGLYLIWLLHQQWRAERVR